MKSGTQETARPSLARATEGLGLRTAVTVEIPGGTPSSVVFSDGAIRVLLPRGTAYRLACGGTDEAAEDSENATPRVTHRDGRLSLDGRIPEVDARNDRVCNEDRTPPSSPAISDTKAAAERTDARESLEATPGRNDDREQVSHVERTEESEALRRFIAETEWNSSSVSFWKAICSADTEFVCIEPDGLHAGVKPGLEEDAALRRAMRRFDPNPQGCDFKIRSDAVRDFVRLFLRHAHPRASNSETLPEFCKELVVFALATSPGRPEPPIRFHSGIFADRMDVRTFGSAETEPGGASFQTRRAEGMFSEFSVYWKRDEREGKSRPAFSFSARPGAPGQYGRTWNVLCELLDLDEAGASGCALCSGPLSRPALSALAPHLFHDLNAPPTQLLHVCRLLMHMDASFRD